jgi:Tfp pilus assembly protein PilV
LKPTLPATRRTASFTVVEVMMATLILMVGFIGVIEGVTVSANTLDHSRRQLFATQILAHHTDELYLASWDSISAWSRWAGTSGPVTSDETRLPIDFQFWPPWSGTTYYQANRVVTHNGVSYRSRAGHINQTPPNATYWTVVSSAAPPSNSDIVTLYGATFTLVKTVTNPDPATDMREVNFTVRWQVNTGRRKPDGLPLIFNYECSTSAWYGKYGLVLSYRQS